MIDKVKTALIEQARFAEHAMKSHGCGPRTIGAHRERTAVLMTLIDECGTAHNTLQSSYNDLSSMHASVATERDALKAARAEVAESMEATSTAAAVEESASIPEVAPTISLDSTA